MHILILIQISIHHLSIPTNSLQNRKRRRRSRQAHRLRQRIGVDSRQVARDADHFDAADSLEVGEDVVNYASNQSAYPRRLGRGEG